MKFEKNQLAFQHRTIESKISVTWQNVKPLHYSHDTILQCADFSSSLSRVCQNLFPHSKGSSPRGMVSTIRPLYVDTLRPLLSIVKDTRLSIRHGEGVSVAWLWDRTREESTFLRGSIRFATLPQRPVDWYTHSRSLNEAKLYEGDRRAQFVDFC